jgi:pimeloyl-ACP methyl ester carboxylesterase
VIALDARGHGDSEWTRDYSFEVMRDDVVRFMEHVGILAAIVIGHSMGAVTAYELAATRPEFIRLLVLEEMPPPDPANPPKPIPREPEPGADYDWRALIAVHRWRNAPPPIWWDYASRIHANTLVLGAAHSTLPQDRLKELSERIPHGTFATMNSNHDGHEARPSEFLMHVEPFIAWFAK